MFRGIFLALLALTRNAYNDELTAVPGVDLAVRDSGGANLWPVPDWSWAGYAGGDYKTSTPDKKFNVMDFGAKRDGKRNDAPAIQAAINAAGSAGGGTVYLPAGRYLIKNQITISKSKIVLKGAGKRATILYSPKSLSEVVKDGVNGKLVIFYCM